MLILGTMYTTEQVQYAARFVYYIIHRPEPWQTRWNQSKQEVEKQMDEAFNGNKDAADRLVQMIYAELTN